MSLAVSPKFEDLADPSENSRDLEVSVDWKKFREPSIAMGLAITAVPLEIFLAPQVVTILIIKASLPRWRETFRHIRASGKPDVELLDTLWIFFHTLTGEFLAPALSLVLLEAANTLRDLTAVHRQKNKVELIPARLYWVERKGRRRRIHLKHLAVGDLIHLGRGDQVPSDAEVVKGECLVDTGLMTGLSRLQARKEGETIYASTFISRGQIVARIKRIGDQTRVSTMLTGHLDKPEEDTRLSNYMEDLGNKAVVPAMIGTATVFLLTGNVNKSLAPLSLDFAQGVGVSAPIPVIRAITRGGKEHGVLVKGGHVLEMLTELDAVIFDKTGTLTEQATAIDGVETFDPRLDEKEILSYAFSATSGTLHPFSAAFEEFCESQGVTGLPAEVVDSSDSGVMAQLGSTRVMVGTRHYLKFHGMEVDEDYHRHNKSVIQNRSVRYVVLGDQIAGAIFYTNQIREDAAHTIASLKAMGIACYLFSGDQSQAVSAVGYKLGFTPTNTFADLTAEDKVRLITRLRESHRRIGYVGDGWNDTPALVAADVGFSFKDGTDLAREYADVVVLNNQLMGIPRMIDASKKAMGLVRQNIAMVISANVITVAGGIFFNMGPLASVLVNNGATVAAGLNGMRVSEEDPRISDAVGRVIRDDHDLLGMSWRKRRRAGMQRLLPDPPIED